MANYERSYRILSSPIALFLYFVVTGSAYWVFSYRHDGEKRLIGVFIIAILYGIAMTLTMKRHFRKFDKATGQTDPKQQWSMHYAVKTGKLPTDPEILKAIPAYLDSLIKANRSSRRGSPLFLTAISIINGVIAISDHDLGDMLLSVFVLLMAVVLYFQATKQAKKLASLQKQLFSNKR